MNLAVPILHLKALRLKARGALLVSLDGGRVERVPLVLVSGLSGAVSGGESGQSDGALEAQARGACVSRAPYEQ